MGDDRASSGEARGDTGAGAPAEVVALGAALQSHPPAPWLVLCRRFWYLCTLAGVVFLATGVWLLSDLLARATFDRPVLTALPACFALAGLALAVPFAVRLPPTYHVHGGGLVVEEGGRFTALPWDRVRELQVSPGVQWSATRKLVHVVWESKTAR